MSAQGYVAVIVKTVRITRHVLYKHELPFITDVVTLLFLSLFLFLSQNTQESGPALYLCTVCFPIFGASLHPCPSFLGSLPHPLPGTWVLRAAPS